MQIESHRKGLHLSILLPKVSILGHKRIAQHAKHPSQGRDLVPPLERHEWINNQASMSSVGPFQDIYYRVFQGCLQREQAPRAHKSNPPNRARCIVSPFHILLGIIPLLHHPKNYLPNKLTSLKPFISVTDFKGNLTQIRQCYYQHLIY